MLSFMKKQFAALSLALTLVCSALTADRPPNFLVILADNLGRDWIGCYGADQKVTPNIDRLAATGVRLETFYVTPLCSTTRVALYTGRYGYSTGWHTHHDAGHYGGGGLDPRRETTWARELRSAGYATAVTGKWQINDLYAEPEVIQAHGFDKHSLWTGAYVGEGDGDQRWKAGQAHPGGERHEIESRYWDPVLFRNGRREELKGKFGPDVFVEHLVEFMERNRDRPFLAFYSSPLTHLPVVRTLSSPDGAGSEREQFAGMVRHLDEQVGRLEAALVRLGLREHTIVFFITDNGTTGSVAGRVGGRQWPAGLGRLNEPGLSVPFIASCPARLAQGRVSRALTDCTDFFPTLLELAGVKPEKNVRLDGQSFAAQLAPGAEPPGRREWIFSMYDVKRVVRDQRFKLYSTGEFFDLAADPVEANNLAVSVNGAAADARRRLAGVLDQMPPSEKLPFAFRSSSARQIEAARAKAAKAKP
jgi:arylsulfatase A-like enzyme